LKILVQRLVEALDLAGGVTRANNFGGQGLTGFNVRGFTSGEFYRNGFQLTVAIQMRQIATPLNV
jgi:outer membrane receptor protein involved in Fe transport